MDDDIKNYMQVSSDDVREEYYRSKFGPQLCFGGFVVFPVFVRLPKAGMLCPWTGLTRCSLNKLILGDDPTVDSVVLTDGEASRGVRLIVFRSLIDYLYSLSNDEPAEVLQIEGGDA